MSFFSTSTTLELEPPDFRFAATIVDQGLGQGPLPSQPYQASTLIHALYRRASRVLNGTPA